MGASRGSASAPSRRSIRRKGGCVRWSAPKIEDILAVAHKRDEEIAKARETAQYAGDADPYKHPEERDDDEFDDDDEYDEYADDLDNDDVEGNGIGVETLEDDAENAADEATGDR